MALKEKKGFTVNQFLIVTTGLVILLGSILIYLYVLRGVFGRFGIDETIPKKEYFQSVLGATKSNVAILYSKYTENMLPEGSTWLTDNITTWRSFLSSIGITSDVISDQHIEFGLHNDYKVLILPGSRSLSDLEIIQIKKFIENGGSVFATSGTASFSQDGKWRGWEFFSEVYGVRFSREISNEEITTIHTLRGNLQITGNIPTGYPLKIATWDRPIAVEVVEPRIEQVSFWYNYRVEGGLVREEIKKTAGIIYGTYGKGRLIWMGFEINSIIGVQEDYIYFERLFRNSMNWLQYNPIAFVKDWPNGYEAAAIITPTLTNNVFNAQNILSILRNHQLKATFFVDPVEAERNPGLIKQLASQGEIAPIIDIGYIESIYDTVNVLDEYEVQLAKFRFAKEKLEEISESKVKGVLPLYGLFDGSSLRALANAGYNYIFTDSLTDRSVPNAKIIDGRLIITMTKTARDDYEVIRNYGLREKEFQFYTYEEDIDRILFEGGMYILKVHTDYQLRSEYVSVINDVIKKLKDSKIWIASASEIYEWWSKKNYLETRVETRGRSRTVLTVSNPSTELIDFMTIDLNLNVKVKNVQVTSEIIGTKLPDYSLHPDQQIISFIVKDIKPGESRIYYIDYDEIST